MSAVPPISEFIADLIEQIAKLQENNKQIASKIESLRAAEADYNKQFKENDDKIHSLIKQCDEYKAVQSVIDNCDKSFLESIYALVTSRKIALTPPVNCASGHNSNIEEIRKLHPIVWCIKAATFLDQKPHRYRACFSSCNIAQNYYQSTVYRDIDGHLCNDFIISTKSDDVPDHFIENIDKFKPGY